MITAASIALSGLLLKPSSAQQVATHILDDVAIERASYNAVIKVQFKQPFRYLSHSPANTGDTINVKIDIIDQQLSIEDQLVDNESIPLSDDKGTGLTEVVYEKNGRNSKYIIFYFDRNVSFEVIQGSDQRSLSIAVFGLD